jgi:RNA 3'-phosphate cyclase
MIEIDGSYGEGGGQIVRTACSLAAVTGKPCHVVNVRLARRNPGLRVQHLLGLQALARLCDGRLEGGAVGSREIAFYPGRLSARSLTIKIGTAGSITLIIQTLLPVALGASMPLAIELEGGATDTAFAPAFDYLRYVFLWLLGRMGADVEVSVNRRGYYPRGGAAVSVTIRPSRLKPIALAERGALRKVSVISHAAGVLKARRVAERQIEGAMGALGSLPRAADSTIDYAPSVAAGSSVCIVAEFEHTVIGADSLGARGKLAEAVGRDAALEFARELESTACLDRHMADQILPYMALAAGGSCVTVSELTAHCRTNMWVIEKFLDGKFAVEGNLIRWPQTYQR